MVFSRIIATGGHSGLGLQALRTLLRNKPPALPPPYHIILFARSVGPTSEAQGAVEELDALRVEATFDPENAECEASGGRIELRQMDLGSLRSVEEEGKRLASELSAESKGDDPFGLGTTGGARSGRGSFDVIFLNAATADSTRSIIHDDRPNHSAKYEHTSLVNHIAPMLLLSMLKDALLRTNATLSTLASTRVVFTGSELHRHIRDPVKEQLERHYDPLLELGAQGDEHGSSGEKSALFGSLTIHYGNSKFLQLVGVLELVHRLKLTRAKGQSEGNKKIEVVYTQPGFIPNTGLNRQSGFMTRLLMAYILPHLPLSFIASLEQGGEVLCEAITAPFDRIPESEWHPPPTLASAPEDAVTFATIVREKGSGKHKGKFVRIACDTRAESKELRERWWPSEADF